MRKPPLFTVYGVFCRYPSLPTHVLVDTDSDERLIRIIKRDVLERGRTAEMVMERYVNILKPMHLEFIEPTKR